MLRVRHGLYATLDAPPDVVRAARVGGRLAGSSQLTQLGAWSPPGDRLTVSVPHNARRLRDPDDAGRPLADDDARVLVLRDGHLYGPGERTGASPHRAAAQVLLHHPPDVAVAVLDSAMRLRPAEKRPDLERVRRLLGRRRVTQLVDLVDDRAEAGSESLVRVRLRDRGITAEPQVWVAPDIRVDLLVDGWLVIECTSGEHHGTPRALERDATRRARLVTAGYVVLEFTYHQIVDDWPAVERAILVTLGR
ncbi:hypothetical protein GCM10027282_20600 [Frigoribacterium salinisoli]